jgi:Do/DeqQ family serine protease
MFKRIAFSILLVLAGFATGLVLTGRLPSSSKSDAAPAGQAATQAPGVRPEGPAPQTLSGLPDVSAVAARATAGIVNISSTSVVRAPDPFFSQFFGEDLFGGRYRPQQSLGSGVVISADGYLVTNHHVVSGDVRDIRVVLADKRELHGQIVGRDPMTDIAVVRVAARNLPVVPWGDSSKLKVGQWVLAIGSPFQLNQSVTLGIVSAIGRTGVGISDYEDFIQTDAAINPGNSGGGLVDTNGQLVGINTAILSQSGGYQGVGFAVPSNLARRIADDLIRYGEVQRGSIGMIRFVTLTPVLAEELGMDTRQGGVLVWEMRRTSSAYQAGVRPGDVVVDFNGQRVEDESQLAKLLADTRAGSNVKLGVLREGKRIDLEVPVVERSTRERTRN